MLWITFTSVVFCLPELNPVNSQTLNYALVAVEIIFTYALGFWTISTWRWFTGPIKQIAGVLPALYSFFVFGSALIASGWLAQRKRWAVPLRSLR